MSLILVLILSLNILNPLINFDDKIIKDDFLRKKETNSLGINVTAKSTLVTDRISGRVLFSKNAGEKLPIASITKLMTVLVFVDLGIDWKTEIVTKSEDRKVGGRVYLGAGEKVTVEDLINLSLVASDNQAVATLVRTSGFSEDEFVQLMNEKAKNIGLINTTFYDPTGLDARNSSTATDLTKLAKEVFSNHNIQEILNKKEYSFKEISRGLPHRAISTDKLLNGFLGEDGEYVLQAGKTGYLPEAGYCFLSQARNEEGKEIIIVILGSETEWSRFQETKGLIVWSFTAWEWM